MPVSAPDPVLPARTTAGVARDASWIGDVGEIVVDIGQRRDVFRQLARWNVSIRYKPAAMGLAWAVFTPVLVALAGTLVRFATAFALA